MSNVSIPSRENYVGNDPKLTAMMSLDDDKIGNSFVSYDFTLCFDTLHSFIA